MHGALGIVPEEVAEGVLRWTVFDLSTPPASSPVPLGEAEHELTGAMRVAAGLLTELGVDEVVPWSASGSITQWRGGRSEKALEKWRHTARRAAKQSRRAWVPHVAPLDVTWPL